MSIYGESHEVPYLRAGAYLVGSIRVLSQLLSIAHITVSTNDSICMSGHRLHFYTEWPQLKPMGHHTHAELGCEGFGGVQGM